jgi:hypothetical protein
MLLECGLKQFSRTVFCDSGARTCLVQSITIDALRELGIILFAWHSGKTYFGLPLIKIEEIS